MWINCRVLVCAIGALLFFSSPSASQSAADNPSTLPLIQFADLTYTGAFRLPDHFVNGDGFTIGGHPLAFNPARNSLFIGSRIGNVAEVAIPTPVNSASIGALPFATFLQGFADPTEGNLWQIASEGASIDGLMVLGDRLYGSASIYYDANNTQRLSHYSRSTNLSTPSFSGMTQVWLNEKSGFVSGYMGTVPAEWQQRLGGTAVTGQCCLPIAWRTSWGPSAFAWNPTDIGAVSPVPAAPLVYYPLDHSTLGRWDTSNPVYGGTTQINGVAVIASTRTALFVGRNGTGPFCYGNGTGDPSLVGTLGPDQEIFCYDPTSTAKGQHAYPYNYQIWAYDLNDLAAVRAGTKQPWDVVPYGVWPFAVPFAEPAVRIGGVGYDASRQILYVSQMYADQDGYGYRPIVHAIKVGGASGSPVSTTPPPPAPANSAKATAVTIAANRAAPRQPGTTISWSATPTGGVAPLQYKWLVYENARWTPKGSWTTSNTFAWTPTVADPNYRVGVWVRSSGNIIDAEEAAASMLFPITGTTSAPPPPPTSTARASAVTLSANRPAPQTLGTTITWSATPTGGIAPHQFKWLVYENARWTASGTWTTSSTFAWTPAIADPNYRVGVWVRSAGNTVDTEEASGSLLFAIVGTVSAPPPPPTTTARATGVALSANRVAPQPPGTPITWSATPAGGVAPHQYKWLVYENARWVAHGAWTASNTFAWTPTIADPNYRVGVWVRSAGNTVDTEEASASLWFAIAGTPSAPPPPTTTARATAVALSANRVAPQPPGTTVTWLATPTGGVAPHQYKWLVYENARWVASGTWTASNSFQWTPAIADPNYRVGVWVRSAGNPADAEESSAAVTFAISGTANTPPPPPTTSARATAVTLSANRVVPQLLGTTVTVSATPAGGVAPLQYKWLVYDGARWTAIGGWTASNTFAWTPAFADPNYRVGVWVRSAGNTADAEETSTSISFPIR